MITREMLQDILAHDGDEDVWVINDDATISVLPADTDLAPLQDPATWPRYFCRSQAIEALVLGNGWEWTVTYVTNHVARTVLAKPAPKALAARAAESLLALMKEKT